MGRIKPITSVLHESPLLVDVPDLNPSFLAVDGRPRTQEATPSWVLHFLLAGFNLENGDPHGPLRSLWALEAMHRACSLIRLVGRLEAAHSGAAQCAVTASIEGNLAADLASRYREVSSVSDDSLVSCNPMLREIVANLVDLFGPTSAMPTLQSQIAQIVLPAFKRRALVLAVSELVINALTHAFECRKAGTLIVDLQIVDAEWARLIVRDDGVGFTGRKQPTECSMGASLVELLDTRLIYRMAPGGGTTAMFTFPISAPFSGLAAHS